MNKKLNISLYTTQTSITECTNLIKHGDSLELILRVIDENNKVLRLEGKTVKLILKKSDSTIFEQTLTDIKDITISTKAPSVTSYVGSEITATLDIQATIATGVVKGEILIMDGSGSITTNTFTLLVVPTLSNSIIEESQDQIQTFTELYTALNKYIELSIEIGGDIEAIQALAEVKYYIDINLPSLKAENDEAVINNNNLHNSITQSQASKSALDISIEEANEFASNHGDIIELDNRMDLAESSIVQIDSQLSENTKQISDTNKQFNPDIYDGCVVTFIDDDGKLTTQNIFKQIADAKGIKFCSAIVETWVGTSDYMTIVQIKSLQDEGHDILNHTYSHQNNWTNFTEQQIVDEINKNKDYMIANGLKGYDIVVYPGTVPNADLNKNATRKVARYGISNIYNATSDVLDNYYMPRIDSDFQTLDGLKAILDQAIINKQWLIILSHSWRPNGGINDTAVFSTDKISQFIDYIQSKNVPIMTFTEAEKYKGNIASIGTYNNNKSIYFSKDGKSNLSGNVVFVNDNTKYSFNNSITDFKADCVTYILIQVSNDTLTGSGGIYKVFRSSVKYYSYAEFSPYNSNKIFRRQWNEINNANVWTAFEEITTGNLKVNLNADNSFLMDAPITSYDIDKETLVIIRTAYDTFLGIGGDMRVFRSSQSNFSYATFTPWNSRSMYMRKWRENSYWGTGISTSNASWSDWRKFGTQSGITENRPSSYIDVGYNYFDTTLGKPIWWNGTSWVDVTGATV